MNVKCKISAYMGSGFSFVENDGNFFPLWAVKTMYKVIEDVEMTEEEYNKILDEERTPHAPAVYLESLSYGFKYSTIKSIHNRVERKHRARFKQRLVNMGKFSDADVERMVDNFHVHVTLCKPRKTRDFDIEEGKRLWPEVNDLLYKEVDGQLKMCGSSNLQLSKHRTVMVYLDELITRYEVKPGTKVIGRNVFENWELDDIILPESLEEIKGNPFPVSDWLDIFPKITSHSPRFTVEDGILYENRADGSRRLIYCFDKNIQHVKTDADTIEPKAFFNCYNLEDIDMPNVKTIGEKAFMNCALLNEVTAGPDLEELNLNCFYECHFLEFVKIGNCKLNIRKNSEMSRI